MIKAFIVDDEAAAREGLQNLIKRYQPDIQVLGSADNVADAIPLLKQFQPDVVFLDVVMPGAFGFALLDQMAPVSFAVIFTTAHQEYAIQAFKLAALDYLLKPVHKDDLAAAVGKLKQKLALESAQKRLDIFRKNLQTEDPQLVLPTTEGYTLTHLSDIVYCQADRNYTRFHLAENRKELVAKTLKEFEDMLTGFQFMRVHRSFLINLNQVRKFFKDNRLEMSNGDTVSIASSRREAFLQTFLNKQAPGES